MFIALGGVLIETYYPRRFVFVLVLTVVVSVVPDILRAKSDYPGVPSDGEIEFDVSMEGDPVGQDRIQFNYTGDTLVVERSVDLNVSYVYINFLDYTHRSTGFWRNGRLQRLRARTLQNGDEKLVRAKRIGDEVAILQGDSTVRSGGTVIPTSWWNPGITDGPTLLDTQFGTFRTVTVRKVGREKRRKGDETVTATHYRVEGDLELQLWYGPDEELVGIQFERRGYTFTYKRTN